MESSDKFAFCFPRNTYRGLSLKEVREKGQKILIEDYDKILSFREGYDKFKEFVDYTETVGIVNGHNLDMNVYFNQDIIKIGNVNEKLNSSSYLFGLNIPEYGIMPGFDVISMNGKGDIEALKEMRNFYESHDYDVSVLRNVNFLEKKVESLNKERGLFEISVINPYELIKSVRELGYNPYGSFF